MFARPAISSVPIFLLFLVLEEHEMYYRLVSLDEVHGWNLRLPAVIGRSVDAQVCIDDASISRSHSQLLLGPDEALQIRDMGSMNGTYVNGERIKAIHSLIPGDLIQIGSVTLKVEYASDTDPGLQPPRVRTSNMNTTQPMKTVSKPTFTMHEMAEPARKWWEFWKD